MSDKLYLEERGWSLSAAGVQANQDAHEPDLAAELLHALIASRDALDALQDHVPMRYNRDLQRLLQRDAELIARAGGSDEL